MQPESKNQPALAILGAALALGLGADILLREGPWGINLTFWIGLLIIGLMAAKRGSGRELAPGTGLLIAPMLIFGACFAWRDSPVLRALDLGAIVIAASLVITRQSAPFWVPSIARVAGSVFNLAGNSLAGFAHLIARDIDWTQRGSSAAVAHARGVAGGAMLALPLLAVFTVLFVRADAAFEAFFIDLASLNILNHLLPITVGGWVSGSYLRGVLVRSEAAVPPKKSSLEVGAMELNVALGLINGLFSAFVAVQVQYLFGGVQLIEATPGLTYSSYARRGFFELVAVALLVLPILLAADQVHRPRENKRLLRLQSVILVAFVLCIMASALHRMQLYQREFGLTELRWHTVAFMIWLAGVFALYCATVLRGLRGLFAMGTLASAFLGILVLHGVNPDRWIANANIENAREGRRFDPDYLRQLSADAVPVVLANAAAISAPEREKFFAFQKTRLAEASNWRAWNYGRHAAARALAEAARPRP